VNSESDHCITGNHPPCLKLTLKLTQNPGWAEILCYACKLETFCDFNNKACFIFFVTANTLSRL